VVGDGQVRSEREKSDRSGFCKECFGAGFPNFLVFFPYASNSGFQVFCYRLQAFIRKQLHSGGCIIDGSQETKKGNPG
jgi:hypothetical protein